MTESSNDHEAPDPEAIRVSTTALRMLRRLRRANEVLTVANARLTAENRSLRGTVPKLHEWADKRATPDKEEL